MKDRRAPREGSHNWKELLPGEVEESITDHLDTDEDWDDWAEFLDKQSCIPDDDDWNEE